MKEIVRDLLSVYPDDEEYWKELPEELKANPNAMPIDTMWTVYVRAKQTKSDAYQFLSEEMKEKVKELQGLTTPEMVDKVFNEIAKKMGETAAIEAQERAKQEQAKKSSTKKKAKKS